MNIEWWILMRWKDMLPRNIRWTLRPPDIIPHYCRQRRLIWSIDVTRSQCQSLYNSLLSMPQSQPRSCLKPHPDLISTETLTRFLLLWWGTTLNKILLRSILSPSSLALSNLALSSPTFSCLSNSQTLDCALSC